MSFSIYHCGHCGSLFSAELGRDDNRVCGVCNQRPDTGQWPVENENEDGSGDPPGNLEKLHETLEEKVHRGPSKRRTNNLLLSIVAFWLILMGLALWLHRHNSELDLVAANRARNEANMDQERLGLLGAALPQCHKSLLGFLNANSPEKRIKFVASPLITAGKMENFYDSNPLPRVDTEQVGRIGQELLKLDGEWMVRTRWQEGEGGDRFDAVFRRESGVWVLDWDHFARFSRYPWEPFLAGDGPDEGEFRLLAREISSDEKAERRGGLLRFVLLSPGDGSPSGTRIDAPEFEVDRLSEEGLLLEAAFAAKREGGGPFGGSMKSMDPEGLVRVRVIVKRSDFGGVREFGVGTIIACHWINSDAPGFDMEKLKDDAFGVN